MQRFNLDDSFTIKKITESERYHDVNTHNYFQIVFIKDGKGKYFINDFNLSYEKGDVFFITHDDKYWFEINKRTTFHYFQFTELLFSGKINFTDKTNWLQPIEYLIKYPKIAPDDIVIDAQDNKTIWDLHHIIMSEFEMKKHFFEHNISNVVSTILSILVRNIKNSTSSKKDFKNKEIKIDEVINYIKQYVYDKNLLKVSALANRFNMTKSGLSASFKKNTGESIHHYILMYKLSLIKYRLLHTDFTVSEIAYQLGFTDESHLTRIFKKYNHMTPKQFKSSNCNETSLPE
ncbi:AraC family transcriptional regulator [Dokdonia sp. Hel_I_53]|uniref:AraC family transcriptional regulator n=1 Tax=Dokdonia sp. Hel_I_53 TaxID=1566287 RepID=UPI00119BFDA8|nr:AraC family transcriptional regulator [Dokdonia sp. Hel_I_53]TVZ51565.1 transcriptional regulator, AraC family [Dokdonia sp. Hel_I_53]